MIINFQTGISTEAIVYELSQLNRDDLKSVIIDLEKSQEDWEFTEDLAKHFVEEMTELFTTYRNEGDEDYRKQWLKFLKKQIREIENV